MKIELHSHTSAWSPCSRMDPRRLVEAVEAAGYDILFLTEHDRVWSLRQLASVREWCDHLKVLPGIEITITPELHLLVLGATDPHYEKLKAPSDILARACSDGFLTVVAHPFRWLDTLPAWCQMADAIEVRSCNHPTPAQAAKASEYAEKHGLAQVYSSDAHGVNFLNRFWIETPASIVTPLQLRNAIVAGDYHNCQYLGDGPLPPHYKAACLGELAEDDRVLLQMEPVR